MFSFDIYPSKNGGLNMDDEYFRIYKELRASGLPPKQAVIKAHELRVFGD
jgi:hypothetical protein